MTKTTQNTWKGPAEIQANEPTALQSLEAILEGTPGPPARIRDQSKLRASPEPLESQKAAVGRPLAPERVGTTKMTWKGRPRHRRAPGAGLAAPKAILGATPDPMARIATGKAQEARNGRAGGRFPPGMPRTAQNTWKGPAEIRL